MRLGVKLVAIISMVNLVGIGLLAGVSLIPSRLGVGLVSDILPDVINRLFSVPVVDSRVQRVASGPLKNIVPSLQRFPVG